MNDKNKSAVHLGRLSAESRRKKMGEEEFKKSMVSLRKKQKSRKGSKYAKTTAQKTLSP